MKSIVYFSALLVLLFLIPDKLDLRGHWHVYPLKGAKLEDVAYTTMEINNDETASFGLSDYDYMGRFNGEIDTWKKTIKFGGECRILDFDYKFKEHYLLLTQQEYGGEFKAVRCESDCCDQQKDFFSYQKHVEIDLPVAIDTIGLIKNKFLSILEKRLLYGITKRKYHINCFGSPQALVLDEKVSNILDIPIWNEKIKIKSPKAHHPLFKVVIYADKEVSLSKIKEGLKKCKDRVSASVFRFKK